MELTDIDGVGPSYAEDLEDAGYETVANVAGADPDTIDDVVPTGDGKTIVESATALLGEEESSDVDDSEAEDVVLDGDVVVLTPGFTTAQENHLIAALVRQEVNARKTNSEQLRDEIEEMIGQIKEGEPYELTEEQINEAYRGARAQEREIRNERGVSSFVGEFRPVPETIREARAKFS